MNVRLRCLSAVLMALALGACDGTSDPDAGPGIDAGGGTDAGSDVDAGPDVDAGGDVDAGTDVDAGPGVDAGGVDAGSIDSGMADAGATPDAGMDAGPVADAGAGSGDTCASAIPLTVGVTLGGSTTGATDDYGPTGSGCPSGGAASGPDVAYSLSPSATTSYTVTVTPSGSFDPMLYAVTTCGTPGCLAGTVLNGAREAESITFSVNGGETAYVIVDGELFSDGDYTIAVTSP